MVLDITKDVAKNKPNNSFLIFVVAVSLIYVLTTYRTKEKRNDKATGIPNAVVVLGTVGIANSTLIDDWADENGYELRRYDTDADLTLAEDWVKMLSDKGKDYVPCVVVCTDERVEVLPITDNLLDALKQRW